ncbi:MAG: ACT domain-containing protein, partial [Clostridia bacterium]|nr:ACT domain-containing protein [Clostridia bacterium]
MLVKQLSIFVENKPGRLSAIIKLLGEHNVNLSALSLADTTNFGVLRLIADKVDVAQTVLREAGIISKSSDVLAVAIDDT